MMDIKDQQLLSLLRKDARLPTVALAKKLGVSRSTVQNRISKLEKNGVILGYTVKLKPEAEVHPVRLFMNISVESKKEANVINDLHKYPEVISIHHISGNWDLIAEVRTETLPQLNSLLAAIRLSKGVLRTETNLVLDTIF
jgi:DNA-binding Lrp family transcriptional regulator